MNNFKTTNTLFITVTNKSNSLVEKVEQEETDVLQICPSNDKEALSAMELLPLQLLRNPSQFDSYLKKAVEIINPYNHILSNQQLEDFVYAFTNIAEWDGAEEITNKVKDIDLQGHLFSNISKSMAVRGLVKRAYSLTQKIPDNPQYRKAFLGKLTALASLKNARKTNAIELDTTINDDLNKLIKVFKEACEKDSELLSMGYEELLDILIEAKEWAYIENLADSVKDNSDLADTLLIYAARRLADPYDEDGNYIENKGDKHYKEALRLIEKTSKIPKDLENQYQRIETLLSIVDYFMNLQDLVKVRDLLLYLEESILKRDVYSQITHLAIYWMRLGEKERAINLWKNAIESTNNYCQEQIKKGQGGWDSFSYIVIIKAVKNFDEDLAYQLVGLIGNSQTQEYILSLLKDESALKRILHVLVASNLDFPWLLD